MSPLWHDEFDLGTAFAEGKSPVKGKTPCGGGCTASWSRISLKISVKKLTVRYSINLTTVLTI